MKSLQKYALYYVIFSFVGGMLWGFIQLNLGH